MNLIREQFKRIAPNKPNLYKEFKSWRMGSNYEIIYKYPYGKLIYEKGMDLITEELTTLTNHKAKLDYLNSIKNDIEITLDSIETNINTWTKTDSEELKYRPILESVLDEILLTFDDIVRNSPPSVSKPKTKEEIKEMISNNKEKDVFEELLKVSENGDLHNSLIILKGEYNRYFDSKIKGLLDGGEERNISNSINDRLLSITDELYE